MSSLKRIEGKFYSPGNVIMLPSKYDNTKEGLCLGDVKKKQLHYYQHHDHWGLKQQHLYIINDDDKNIGDWVLCLDEVDTTLPNWSIDQVVFKYNGGDCTGCKKIVATTDPTLKIQKGEKLTPFPQPSMSFVKRFVELYQNGKMMTDVLIEYGYKIDKSLGHFNQTRIYSPKIDKNNFITIKKPEVKMYTQKQVDDLLDRNTSEVTAQLMSKYKDYKKENLKN